MRWLAVYLPKLSLECLLRGVLGDVPLVVVAPGRRALVRQVSPVAVEAGVHPGMTLAAAAALWPELCAREADPERETAALEWLAVWAGRFTPRVSLVPGAGLLLEVAGSGRLFGGLEALRDGLRTGLEGLGYRHLSLGISPTPQGAWLLARGADDRLTGEGELETRIGALPLSALELPGSQVAALTGVGLATVGDLLRLPRAGVARRFGKPLLIQLDRALGRVPDPRPAFIPPLGFGSGLELPHEVHGREPLLFALRRLLHELEAYLTVHGSGVRGLALSLSYTVGGCETVPLTLVTPSRDPDHLLLLFRERLERLELAAPVSELHLMATDIAPLKAREVGLFGGDGADPEAWPHLLERLRARLGGERVRGLTPAPDHRPEWAWKWCPPGTGGATAALGERPLWLLPRACPLAIVDGRPRLRGALELTHGPERIESGWWDGEEVARDYFTAVSVQGGRYWVFREGGAWFLHGVFG